MLSVMFLGTPMAPIKSAEAQSTKQKILRTVINRSQRGTLPPSEHNLQWEEGKFSSVDYQMYSVRQEKGAGSPSISSILFLTHWKETSNYFKKHKNHLPQSSVIGMRYRDVKSNDVLVLPSGTLCKVESIDMKKQSAVLIKYESKNKKNQILAKKDSIILPIGSFVSVFDLALVKATVAEMEPRLGRNKQGKVTVLGCKVGIPQRKLHSIKLPETDHAIYEGGYLPLGDVAFQVTQIVLPSPKENISGWIELDATPRILETNISRFIRKREIEAQKESKK